MDGCIIQVPTCLLCSHTHAKQKRDPDAELILTAGCALDEQIYTIRKNGTGEEARGGRERVPSECVDMLANCNVSHTATDYSRYYTLIYDTY